MENLTNKQKKKYALAIGTIIDKYQNLQNPPMKNKTLAKMIFYSPQILSDWKNGRRVPSLRVIIKLSEIFGKTFLDEISAISLKNPKE